MMFKESCQDIRNSKVEDIIIRLKEYGINSIVVYLWASNASDRHEYGIDVTNIKDINDADVIVFATAHNEFKELTWEQIDYVYSNCNNLEKVSIDVKGIFNIKELERRAYSYWRL